MKAFAAAALALSAALSVNAGATVDPNNLPHTSESGQYGYNDCTKYGDSPSANCQTLHIESLDDFCLYAPPKAGSTIGDTERYEVAWCTKAGHGARLLPKGTITGAHMIRTPNYIQISGTLDGTKINIKKGDDGGELDPHGADGNGNPIGAVVLSTVNGKLTQIKEWTSFISDDEFCIRACYNGPDAWRWCNHIYDVMGCYWNEPGSYAKGSFDTCKADNVAYPMGEYPVVKNGKTSISTWHQGVNPTPAAQKAAKSSQCTKQATIVAASYGVKTTTKATTTAKPTTTTKKTTTTTTTKKATATAGTCKVTKDCKQKLPANAHYYCNKALQQCTFNCNKNYKKSGNKCVKA